MLPRIPQTLLDLYGPLSLRESFYLRMRWRLCPFELIQSFMPHKGRILDFGCGYGLLSNLLNYRSPDRSITGIDLNAKRIAVARRSVLDRANVAFHVGDVLDLDPEPFDAVVMTDVLHHIDDARVQVLLRKIHACLDEKGLLTILDVDRKPFWKFCVTFAIDTVLNPTDRLWYRPLTALHNLLKVSGMRVEKTIRADRGLPLADVLLLCRKESV